MIHSRGAISRYWSIVLSVLGWMAASDASAASCASLTSLSLPNAEITAVREVAAGTFTLPQGTAAGGQAPNFAGLQAFCRVTAISRPSSDSAINIEVWMPAANWNTQFQPVGPGLWGGVVNYQGLATMLRAGYATATTDMGHVGPGASFALGHPEKLLDFGYRAFHEMTLLAKAAIERFYEVPPSLSFVDQGGGAVRGVLAEVQRYPDSYDIVGAWGIDPESTRHSMGQIWVWQAAHKTPESALPPDKLALLHRAALDACDSRDGIADGIIADPLRCKVDPSILQCRAGGAGDCLSAAQVEAARTIYSPVVNPRTKEFLFGPLLPGSELGWGLQTAAEPFGYGTDFFRYLVMKDPNWHPRNRPVDFDRDAALAETPENLVINIEPNLNRFIARGGKLLIVGGWADTAIAPSSNTTFYEQIVRNAGPSAEKAVRLFMVPGMAHFPSPPDAANGHVIDTTGILMQWHRTGEPPDSIIVSRRVDGAEERKMLVCRYPQVAFYKGSGDPKVPANYECR